MELFLPILIRICFYGIIVIFLIVTFARIRRKATKKTLVYLKQKSEKRLFIILLFIILISIGGITSAFVAGRLTHHIEAIHILAGLSAGVILSVLTLSVIHLLYHHSEN